jgi:hypothetical protein
MNTARVPVLTKAALALAIGSTMAGCSPMPATTIDGIEAFRNHALRVDLASLVNAEDLARCFEASAGLLPGSTFTPFPESGEYVYRLRAGPYMFESVAMSPLDEGGSRAVVEVTPDYNSRMRKEFIANRLDPLYRCAAVPMPARWPASHMGRPVVAAGAEERT